MEPKARILIIDQDSAARAALADPLRAEGHRVESAADLFWALPRLAAFAPDVVVADLKMITDGDNVLLAGVLEGDPERAIVVVCAPSSLEAAGEAVRAGAAAWITRPVQPTSALIVERALERRRLRLEAAALRTQARERAREEQAAGGEGMPAIPGASLPELERYAILKTLDHTGGSRARAAQILQISTRKIQYKLVEYDVVRPREHLKRSPRERASFHVSRSPVTPLRAPSSGVGR